MERDEDGNGPKVAWEEKLDHAIKDTLDAGEMVLRWIAVVEVMDVDGSKGLYSMVSPGLQAWEGLGMLRYMQAQQEFALQVDVAVHADDEEQGEDD